MKTIIQSILSLLILVSVTQSCGPQKKNDEKQKEVKESTKSDLPWLKSAVLYEVDLIQYTASGNFKGFSGRLDSLKMLGVDVLMFMPLQPIGIKNNTGIHGRYYAIQDHKSINAKFGTSDDFRILVEKCHEKGFKVIIDWEANYTSRDNKLLTDHPDWYSADSAVKLVSPIANSGDEIAVAKLNYEKNEVNDYMIGAMKWWVDEFEVDGFRCHMANGIPTVFWEMASEQLNQTKKVLMLAHAEQADHMEKAFHACYGFKFNEIMKGIYKGTKNADSLINYLVYTAKNFPADAAKVYYTAYHDQYAYFGTSKELFGELEEQAIALSFTINGIPLVYNGSEVGNDKRLTAMNTDAINWNTANAKTRLEFYKTLISIRHKNPSIWTNVDAQTNTRLFKQHKNVYAFIRQSGENKVLVVANMSGKTVQMDSQEIPGLEKMELRLYKNMKTDGVHLYELGPWGYSVSTINENTD